MKEYALDAESGKARVGAYKRHKAQTAQSPDSKKPAPGLTKGGLCSQA